MAIYPESVQKLIEKFSKLPGIGGKSAQRLAFHIIHMPENEVRAFAETLVRTREDIRYCSICCNLTDSDPCALCSSSKRDQNQIMVVEDPRDMAAYEKTRQYKGVYHILHGAISPSDGVTSSDIRLHELLVRIGQNPPEEVILATNPNVEGEATAMYIAQTLKPLDVKVTRIANGVPVGGDLEYIDEVTLYRALCGRQEM